MLYQQLYLWCDQQDNARTLTQVQGQAETGARGPAKYAQGVCKTKYIFGNWGCVTLTTAADLERVPWRPWNPLL